MQSTASCHFSYVMPNMFGEFDNGIMRSWENISTWSLILIFGSYINTLNFYFMLSWYGLTCSPDLSLEFFCILFLYLHSHSHRDQAPLNQLLKGWSVDPGVENWYELVLIQNPASFVTEWGESVLNNNEALLFTCSQQKTVIIMNNLKHFACVGAWVDNLLFIYF